MSFQLFFLYEYTYFLSKCNISSFRYSCPPPLTAWCTRGLGGASTPSAGLGGSKDTQLTAALAAAWGGGTTPFYFPKNVVFIFTNVLNHVQFFFPFSSETYPELVIYKNSRTSFDQFKTRRVHIATLL